MTGVSVVIPTFRRLDSFRRAVASVLAQTVQDFEIVVVDNDPDGSALDLCRAFAAEHPGFRFAHEPRPGVSNARNAAMALATGDIIAFLDDDQEAPAHWLERLLAQQAATQADVVWGPVTAQVQGAHAAYFQSLYSRRGPATNGLLRTYFGIGNALLVRERVLGGEAPFDTRANETGGEDDRLFAAAQSRGARFAWAADAGVIEHVPASRARIGHALKRAFAYGQGPSETAIAEQRPLALLRHMGIGGAQFLAYSLAALLAILTLRPSRLSLMDRAARGAGKVFWFAPMRFYGAAALRCAP